MEGDLQEVVGENLRRLRHMMGHSQESFAEHVGWHRTFVGSVERGERNLTLRTVERLAAQVGVHPLSLLFDGVAAFEPVVEEGLLGHPVTFAADEIPQGRPPRPEAASPEGTGTGAPGASPAPRSSRSRTPRPR